MFLHSKQKKVGNLIAGGAVLSIPLNQRTHVDYERPPVIEVVCGVQFKELKSLSAPMLGVFWAPMRDEYSERPTTVAPLPHVIEGSIQAVQRESRVRLMHATVIPRTFFIHRSKNWVMQVQGDRFLHNWRKETPDPYPRFTAVFDRFSARWIDFQQFCVAELDEKPRVDQLELTYINHLPAGEGWDELSEVGAVFPDISWRKNRSFLPTPESVTLELTFPLPGEQGRLHVSVQPGVNPQSKQQVLLCELTARGMPDSIEDGGFESWFELAREWIVKGFADLVDSDLQQRIWKRTK